MSTIVFHPLQFASHMNASFKLAKTLRSRGHKIVYLSFPEMKNIVTSQGLEFIPIPIGHYPLNNTCEKNIIKRKLNIYFIKNF